MLALHRYRGLAFIALWQTAPIVVHQDSAGRVQIHLAAGGGRFEEVSTDCDGNVIGTEDFRYVGGGAAVEAWPTTWSRVNAFAGFSDSESAEYSSLNFGALAAIEARSAGLGVGVTVLPGRDARTFIDEYGTHYEIHDATDIFPVAYARAGNIDQLHLRLESSSDRGVDRMGGVFRLGMGYNQGLLRGTRAFGGVAACHAGCDGDDGETPMLFLDLVHPVSGAFDIRAGAALGAGEASPEYGLTLGGTWHFRPVAAPAGHATAPSP